MAVGSGYYSFRVLKAMRNYYAGPAAMGAAFYLAYMVMSDWVRHHGHSNGRPRMLDDFYIFGILGGALFFLNWGIRYTIHGAVIGSMLFTPTLYLLKEYFMKQHTGHSNRFWDDTVSEEEKDKILYQDLVEELAFKMNGKYRYGFNSKQDQRFINW